VRVGKGHQTTTELIQSLQKTLASKMLVVLGSYDGFQVSGLK
jgi:hypothetical protein